MIRAILRYLFSLALCFCFGMAYPHSDLSWTKEFGRVKVRIKTGYDYEEIQKIYLIGELTEKYAKLIGYDKVIFLDFNHFYVGNCEPDYFISYDRGAIMNLWNKATPEYYLDYDALVIRQVASLFDVCNSLQLVEYAVSKVDRIVSLQRMIEYDENYCHWRINSIDTVEIKHRLQQPISKGLHEILNIKLERPGKLKEGVSYYFQENLFTVFSRLKGKPDKDIISLTNIYQLTSFRRSAFLFDTDSSFYFINGSGSIISKKVLIRNADEHYTPFEIKPIENGNFSISYWSYSKESGMRLDEKRTLFYDPKTNELKRKETHKGD